MPPYNNSDYSDTEEAPAEAPMPEGEGQPENAQEGGREEQTTTVPKSFCPGMKIGDLVTGRIEQSTDGEYVLKYVPQGKGKSMRETDGEMASMLDE